MANTVLRKIITLTPERIRTALKTKYYTRMLSATTLDAEPDLSVLPMIVHDGCICLDAGANTGLYTKHLSDLVGHTGHVFSFEPTPETYHYLRANRDALKLSNVDVFHAALSDHSGFISMSIPDYKDGTPNLYRAHVVPGSETLCITIDQLALPKLDFVKIDVEGHELEVLRGATETLRRLQPALLVETEQPEVFELLLSLGYTAWITEGKGITKHKGEKGVNYFFLFTAQSGLLKTAAQEPVGARFSG